MRGRTVRTGSPSFPDAPADTPLTFLPDERWQVLCGDAGRWRVGIYAPAETRAADLAELERHDCPELFVLLSGRLTLLLFTSGGLCELELQPNRPVLVTAPHGGFCPDGPHSGVALVVERDELETEYRPPDRWL